MHQPRILPLHFRSRRALLLRGQFMLLVLAVLLVLSLFTPAHAQTWQWARQSAGTGSEAPVHAVTDGSGNTYVVGSFTGTATFGSFTLASVGPRDGFVGKINPSGTWLWVTRTAGTGQETCQGVVADGAGNVFVTGYFDNSLTLGPTALNAGGAVAYDVFVGKLNASGVWQWGAQAGGPQFDMGQKIGLDNAGNLYVTGQFQGTASFGGNSLSAAGSDDAFVGKLNASGAWQWVTRGGGSASEIGDVLVVDATGNAYVAGSFDSPSATFGPFTLTGTGSDDAFVGKVNASGVWQWVNKLTSPGFDAITDLRLDAAGVLHAGGGFSNTVTLGGAMLTSAGDVDALIGRLNASTGTWSLAFRMGGAGLDFVRGLTTDAAKNIYATGAFSGFADFGPMTLTSAGAHDGFVVRQATGGAWQWAVRAGGPDSDAGGRVGLDNSGNLYLTGSYSGSVTLGSTTLTNGGAMDRVFVAKLPPQPVITSFSPLGGAVGTVVAINGTNLTGALGARFSHVAATGFYTHSNSLLNATVAPGSNLDPKPVPVQLVLPDGFSASVASFSVQGDVTVKADSVAAIPGQQVVVPVRVNGFTSMIALQASLAFDPAQLTYVGVEAFGLNGLTAAAFNATQVASGKLSLAWNSPSNAAVTLAAGAQIVGVRFAVNAALPPGTTVPVTLTNAPLPVEVVNSTFSTVSVLARSGKVQVPAAVSISGLVYTAGQQQYVPGATLTISGPQAPAPQLTPALAGYAFNNLIGTATYTISAGKTNDQNVLNGISVADIALIQRHILNVAPLGNAYKAVAADVDRSSSITALDVSLIRNLLLGNAATFPKGRLWTFVRSSQQFANPNQPWPVDTFRVCTTPTDLTGQDFVGCKLGDVNASWNAAIPRPVPGAAPLALAMGSAQTLPGQRLTLPLTVGADLAALGGLQLTLTWDPAVLQLVGSAAGQALPGLVTSAADARNGHLTLIWTDPAGAARRLSAGERLLTLEFDALSPGTTAVEVTGDVTEALAVDGNLETLPLTTTAGAVAIGQPTGLADGAALAALTLYPNPARAEAVRVLPGATTGSVIDVLDALGRVVRTVARTEGATNITVSLKGLPAGLYRVRCGAGSVPLVIAD